MQKNTTQKGSALMGIIIILIILILGGVYMWKMTKKQAAQNLAAQKALQEQSASVNESFQE